MLNRHRHRRIPVKRNTPGHHLIHDDSQRINIAFAVHKPVSGLLRRGIVNGTHNVRADRIGRCRPCDSEIRYLNLSLRGYYDILWLNVPVNNILAVSRLNTASHLYRNAYGFLKGELYFFFNIGL